MKQSIDPARLGILPGVLTIGVWMAMLVCPLFLKPVYSANKGVLLAPTRVVFEGRTRSTTVQLINPHDQPCRYKISLVSLRMDESGVRREVENLNEQELLSRDMIRFSPRRATVGPKQWQTIRLMVRKPRNLPQGEYRVHLKAAPVPDIGPDAGSTDEKKTGVSFKINYVFNVTIPIFIRHGSGSAGIEIPDPPILIKGSKPDQFFLETTLIRTGNHSIFADVAVNHRPNQGTGQKTLIGEVKGISLYTPNRTLTLKIPVSPENRRLISTGTLEIEVVNREKNQEPILGRANFRLN